MNKITGFKVVSIIYFILMLVLGIACFFLRYAIKMPGVMASVYSIFFIVIAVPMHLATLGVKEEKIEEMANHILEFDSTDNPYMYVSLNKKALIRILKESM